MSQNDECKVKYSFLSSKIFRVSLCFSNEINRLDPQIPPTKRHGINRLHNNFALQSMNTASVSLRNTEKQMLLGCSHYST